MTTLVNGIEPIVEPDRLVISKVRTERSFSITSVKEEICEIGIVRSEMRIKIEDLN